MVHHDETLRKMFNTYPILTIPYYQRKYVWNSENKGRTLYKFVDDICNEYRKSQESNYFIGSLALCSHDSVCDVVDGQQRLTSIIVFLSVLADNFCSKPIKDSHKKLAYCKSSFVIQEPFYLTSEIEGVLGYKPYSGSGFKVKLDETVIKFRKYFSTNLKDFSQAQYDGLYNYILDHVHTINIEYTNVSDALRYFLNINSLSVPLTSSEIFYTILSQALQISHNSTTIFDISLRVKKITETYKGIKKVDDVLYIFVQAYYSKDAYISELGELGVGKWMSYYHIEVFSDAIYASNFCKDFMNFLKDLEHCLKYFYVTMSGIDDKSPLFLSHCLLTYESDSDVLDFMCILFKYRHNYSDKNIYIKNTNFVDKQKLEDISRRLNLTLIHNYIRDFNGRLDGLVSNIDIDSSGKEKLSINDIISNMNLASIFVLGYLEPTSFQSNPHINIKDKSKTIKIIFALQEAYLNATANPAVSFNKYVAEILNGNKFTIEHLYSVKEFSDANRSSEWAKKGSFTDAASFDMVRSKFENLSLLNWSANSTANDKTLYDKMADYKKARSIFSTENEYLIQSLVDGSEFYNNPEIAKLGLPERKITNIITNTWDLSPNNRNFNLLLLELAINAI